jgi:hypothetical protein
MRLCASFRAGERSRLDHRLEKELRPMLTALMKDVDHGRTAPIK